jgi:hypothetical protein
MSSPIEDIKAYIDYQKECGIVPYIREMRITKSNYDMLMKYLNCKDMNELKVEMKKFIPETADLKITILQDKP